MNARETAEYMFEKDLFSQWLGIELTEIKDNYCLIKMPVKSEMINGLGTVHGGVTFAFADSALAFSSNNSGEAAVALNCYINFTKAAKNGDVLTAESILLNDTRKTAIYDITIKNQNDEVVAGFRGTVYKIGKKVTELKVL
ncbi:MAG: phenylacetic acid degradation protein PaaD [Chryseobacterium sp. 36-9]|uniref:Acyl-CoA thioesterase n=1 Tax=Epilithonimonas pallida TaxID=373671 RepID=A0ABY1R2Q6_9FLAO|nr:hydroxyphenylacetyl-CoA thioesterase PaaI [Epilithonimonas pallida]OJX29355.1 MAG: phenylacetic acid degradation protein PaaD [Chryseobacterium sp. 36-9]SMP93657.1 acyl-CoA thioesterase [Epilithonimonas pallida]